MQEKHEKCRHRTEWDFFKISFGYIVITIFGTVKGTVPPDNNWLKVVPLDGPWLRHQVLAIVKLIFWCFLITSKPLNFLSSSNQIYSNLMLTVYNECGQQRAKCLLKSTVMNYAPS